MSPVYTACDGAGIYCIPLNDGHINAVDTVREQLWQLYRDLKTYKLEPTATEAEAIKSRFQAMCRTQAACATLNQTLRRMGDNQHKLLRILDKPYLPPPPHNKLGERDIRDYVKKRNTVAAQALGLGKSAATPFARLKKACLKHKV